MKGALRDIAMNGHWWKIALQSFSGAVLMALSLFAMIAACVHYGIVNLFGLTALASGALACCKTLFSWCLVSPTMFMAVIPWVGFGILSAGLLVAIFKAVKNLLTAQKFAGSLHTVPACCFPVLEKLSDAYAIPIVAFDDTRLKSAFALGFIRPKVYISTGLAGELTQNELISVVMHEIHHVEKKDPLKLFLLSFIRDMFFFLPLAYYLSNIFHRTKELAADERAAKVTGRPVDLAQALLKMVTMKRESVPVGTSLLENRSLVAERVRELLEPGHGKIDKKPLKFVLATTAAVVFVLGAVLTPPIYAGGRHMEKCNHNHFLVNGKVSPAGLYDCKKMCATMGKS